MDNDIWIQTTRACDVVQVPFGNTLTLPAASEVKIAQDQGAFFTVVTPSGFLLRIEGKDADVLGRQRETEPDSTALAARPFSEALVWEVLRSCYDPEIPINVVDLGLIYDVNVLTLDDDSHAIELQMTLTAPGCAMADILKDDIESKLRALPSVSRAVVDIVFEPPWEPERMSEAAMLAVGLL